MNITPQQLHIPVLLESVLTLLTPKTGERYLDLTAGYGGHARAVIALMGDGKTDDAKLASGAKFATLVDRDEFAIGHLSDLAKNGAQILHKDFLSAAKQLAEKGETFDMILLDLGVSSVQLDFGDRGFSFAKEAPLDMRMDRSQNLTAAEIVNHYSEKNLVKILTEYGEESPRMSAKIAREIIWRRKKQKFTTTNDLSELVRKTVAKADHGKFHKIHPATKTFQAIRIAVNDELGQLEKTLEILPNLLNDGGRLAAISFHSLEDRIVKNFFRENNAAIDFENQLNILTKKPVKGSEFDNNPRARSAKLRVAVKINKNRKE